MNFIRVLKTILISLIIVASAGIARSQFYLNGQDPASLKWSQIKTPTFNIIFPESYTEKAQEYANILELSKYAVNQHYNSKFKRFKVVLHNQTTTSNAMVSPTPFHADFYEMPDQSTYAQTWSKQLSLHEYRHAVQMQKMLQGFTKGLYYLIGDQATAIIFGAFIPFWFIEGDAVVSETMYSNSGRGRSPVFSMDLKAQLLDKKIYSYDKAQFGSYKNYTPDHYTLGYHLVLRGINKYGSDIWNTSLNRTSKTPFMLFPFSSAIKKYHGKGKVGFYKDVMEELKKEWKRSDTGINYFLKQPEYKSYTDLRFPNTTSNNRIIALKRGIDDIDRFVMIDEEGSEEIIFTPGFIYGNSLSANDSLICWNERAFYIGWSLKDFSIIKIHNYKTWKTKSISKKSRYFSPQLSHNSKYRSSSQVDENGENSLVIIEIASSKIIAESKTINNYFIINQQWSTDDKSIIYIGLGDNGKAIFEYLVDSDKHQQLTEFTFEDIKFASKSGNKLIFSAPYGKTNNIYLKTIDDNKLYKLTNTRFNVSDIKFIHKDNEEFVIFSEYTADGYKISKVSSDVTSIYPTNEKELSDSYEIDKLVSGNTFNLDDVDVNINKYEIKKYNKLSHLFNLHSWGPTVIDANTYSFSPGVNLLSQNLLSTSVASLGYYYDTDEEAGKFKFNYDYFGLFPVLSFGFEHGNRKQFYTDDSTNQNVEIKYSETDLSVGSYIPLNFTRSKWIWGIQPYLGAERKILSMKDTIHSFKEDNFTGLTYRINLYNRLKRSKRDIFPKWGQSIDLIYRHTINSSSTNKQFAARAYLYFPSVFNHHGFRIYSGYQNKITEKYSYSNFVTSARGYSSLAFNEFMSFKVDYAFPIIYPDIDIPSVAYLSRVYAHIFGDSMYDIDGQNL
ncbi:MAG: hypothetical protein C0598_00305, partial [Marinilabiliales bacterium]